MVVAQQRQTEQIDSVRIAMHDLLYGPVFFFAHKQSAFPGL